MRGVQQVADDLVPLDEGKVGIGELHVSVIVSRRRCAWSRPGGDRKAKRKHLKAFAQVASHQVVYEGRGRARGRSPSGLPPPPKKGGHCGSRLSYDFRHGDDPPNFVHE